MDRGHKQGGEILRFDPPPEGRTLLELMEEYPNYDEELFDAYIEEKRYAYREEWFEFLEALDKE